MCIQISLSHHGPGVFCTTTRPVGMKLYGWKAIRLFNDILRMIIHWEYVRISAPEYSAKLLYTVTKWLLDKWKIYDTHKQQ